MAYAHVTLVGKTGDNSGSALTIATDAFALTAGNLVVFMVTAGANVDPSVSPTDTAGNTYTQLASCKIADNTNSQFVWAYYCANCLGNAANVVTVTWAANKSNRGILGGQYSGIGTGAVDQQIGQLEPTPGTGADGCNSTTKTNSVQPALLWGACMNTGSLANTPTAGTGFTSRSNGINLGGGSDQARYEDKRLTALAAVESTFTAPANNAYITIMAIFDEPAAAPSVDLVTPNPIYTTETGIIITGSTYGASQGAGTVKISPTDNVADGAAITQTVTAWADTSITFTALRSTLGHGTLYLFVTENGGTSNASGYPVQFLDTPSLGWIKA